MKTSRFTDEQTIGFFKQAEAGMSIKDIYRSGGFSQPTFYKWRSRFGGMEASDAASLSNGRRIKFLTVADDFSHECLDNAVDYWVIRDTLARLSGHFQRQ